MTNDSANNLSDAPRVSVLMIAYNKQDYIDDAIAGVVRQRYSMPFELIIMDDCSTDSTGEIAQAWQRRYPHIIRYVRNQHNLGLQGNYLRGFTLCRGTYMAICDADDYWFCHKKLKIMAGYMDAHPECAITFHRVVNYYESTGEKSLSNPRTPSHPDIAQLACSNFITNLSVMYRRELVDLKALPSWIASDRSPDYAMHMIYASKGTIRYFSRPMGVYRRAEGSAWSAGSRLAQLRMSLSVRMRLFEEFGFSSEVQAGLRKASKSILQAMCECPLSASEKTEIENAAQVLGIAMEPSRQREPKATHGRPLLTRIRAAVSKLIPLPRP